MNIHQPVICKLWHYVDVVILIYFLTPFCQSLTQNYLPLHYLLYHCHRLNFDKIHFKLQLNSSKLITQKCSVLTSNYKHLSYSYHPYFSILYLSVSRTNSLQCGIFYYSSKQGRLKPIQSLSTVQLQCPRTFHRHNVKTNKPP